MEMLKQANKVEDTVLKEIVKAKKTAIKEPAVTSAEILEAGLAAVLSSNEKILKKEGQLVDKVDKKCETFLGDPRTIFPGVCAGPPPFVSGAPIPLGDIQDCVIAASRCVACLKINAFDALNIDCDQADNQSVDGSCPIPLPTPPPTPTPTGTPTPTVTGAPLLISVGPLSLAP